MTISGDIYVYDLSLDAITLVVIALMNYGSDDSSPSID